jgi:uncharacterized protein (DUF1501 family)
MAARRLDPPLQDRLSRRELLRLGTLATLGCSTAARASTNSADASGFGQAKRCLLIYLWGSPSQLETFDPKPDAPLEVRGEFQSIATAIPGVRIGEILPRIASLLGRVTILRSLTHDFPIHGTAFATTAVPTTDLQLEGNIRDGRHWPFLGSVVDYVCQRTDPSTPPVPRNFGLPFPIGSKRRLKPGPFGAFLGAAYDPIWTEFRAPGTRAALRDAGAPDVQPRVIADPYLGILPTDRFESTAADERVPLAHLQDRLSLLDQLQRSQSGQIGETAFQRHRNVARSLLMSRTLHTALDVQREPANSRERYGMNLFGQSCLAARRLLEAGGKFVTVCWDEYGLVNTGWDTHIHMRSRLKDELGPGFDNAFASLLEDLADRGLLADTAIVVVSEHGRTPKVQQVSQGGRDHWARAYSALFAGGGFAQGRVVGRTDHVAGEVADTPFSPKDIIATTLHLLGIDPHLEVHDPFGRPFAVGGEGRVRAELLA